MNTMLRRLLMPVGALVLVLLLAASAMLAELWFLLKPAPGEWSHAVRIGRVELAVSVPGLLRMATHPMAAPLIDGRSLGSPLGRWQWRAGTGQPLRGRCAPCRIHIAALGAQPLELAQARIEARREGAQGMRGTLWLGEGDDTLTLPWSAKLSAQGAQLVLTLDEVPAARMVRVFGTAMPEVAHVRIEGRVALKARARFGVGVAPLGAWQIEPRLEGLVVSGLGTERLAGAEAPAACRTVRSAAAMEGWLPRAVVAAEDQRFYEHPGYDLTELMAAFQRNQDRLSPGDPTLAPHGASTITQQLAKLLVTGSDRSAARKLRELLYAVEMERTLGKGRILQLYLALAPWGDGVCGAARAAEAHLGRSVDTLGPVASAWLASLLTNPQRQLQALAAGAEPDRQRLRRILEDMRPMHRLQREKALEQLASWQPPMQRPGLIVAPKRVPLPQLVMPIAPAQLASAPLH
ncbi:MAG: transglycosylase domain-containing protein [Inhella sp.]|nr:transglycosylase domain-containing protein [Inhella sp.]